MSEFATAFPNSQKVFVDGAQGVFRRGECARQIFADLTTREPTLDQVEVSINALKNALAGEQAAQDELGAARVEVMA